MVNERFYITLLHHYIGEANTVIYKYYLSKHTLFSLSALFGLNSIYSLSIYTMPVTYFFHEYLYISKKNIYLYIYIVFLYIIYIPLASYTLQKMLFIII